MLPLKQVHMLACLRVFGETPERCNLILRPWIKSQLLSVPTLAAKCQEKRPCVPDGRPTALKIYLELCKSSANIYLYLQLHISAKLLKVNGLKETVKDLKRKRPRNHHTPLWLDKGTPCCLVFLLKMLLFFPLRLHQVLPLFCLPLLYKSNTDKTICVTGCENTVKSFLRAGVAGMHVCMKRACSGFLVCWAL